MIVSSFRHQFIACALKWCRLHSPNNNTREHGYNELLYYSICKFIIFSISRFLVENSYHFFALLKHYMSVSSIWKEMRFVMMIKEYPFFRRQMGWTFPKDWKVIANALKLFVWRWLSFKRFGIPIDFTQTLDWKKW